MIIKDWFRSVHFTVVTLQIADNFILLYMLIEISAKVYLRKEILKT